MNTLATAQNKRQVNALVAQLEALGDTETRWGNTTVSVKRNGVKILGGATAGGKWCVQVSTDVAEQFKLPLWKDS